MAWLLLAAISQIYSENNKDQKGHMRCVQFHQKGSSHKFGAKESMTAENISIERNEVFCLITIRKMALIHLINLKDPTFHRLKIVKP